MTLTSVADPGCFSGLRIRLFSIPDPGSEFFSSRIRIKELKYFNPKNWFLSSRKYDPGCSFRIPDPDPAFLPIPDPGVKKPPDPGSRSAALALTILNHRINKYGTGMVHQNIYTIQPVNLIVCKHRSERDGAEEGLNFFFFKQNLRK